jgi:hypothetical protein
MGFLAFALLLPKTSQAGGSTELPEFGLPALGNAEDMMETGFSLSEVARNLLQQEGAFEAVEFGFGPALIILGDPYERLGHERHSIRHPPHGWLARLPPPSSQDNTAAVTLPPFPGGHSQPSTHEALPSLLLP